MKIVFAFIVCLAFVSPVFSAQQYHSIGSVQMSTSTASGGFGLWNLSISQINNLTPTTTGQMVFCKDCAANGAKGTICISTGSTTTYEFVLSTGSACK